MSITAIVICILYNNIPFRIEIPNYQRREMCLFDYYNTLLSCLYFNHDDNMTCIILYSQCNLDIKLFTNIIIIQLVV